MRKKSRSFRLALQAQIRQNPSKFGKFRQFPTLKKKRENGGEIRFTVSMTLYRYLGLQAEKSVLGKTENDVARQILTNTLALMREEDYRDPDTNSPS